MGPTLQPAVRLTKGHENLCDQIFFRHISEDWVMACLLGQGNGVACSRAGVRVRARIGGGQHRLVTQLWASVGSDGCTGGGQGGCGVSTGECGVLVEEGGGLSVVTAAAVAAAYVYF